MTATSPEEIARLASRYSILVQWSPANQLFTATMKEWGIEEWGIDDGARVWETTPEEAYRVAREVIELSIAGFLEEGRPLPEPWFVSYEDSDASTTEA